MPVTHLYAYCEPTRCPSCGARRQYNTDYDVIHARAGTVYCPPQEFSEDPVTAAIQALKSAA